MFGTAEEATLWSHRLSFGESSHVPLLWLNFVPRYVIPGLEAVLPCPFLAPALPASERCPVPQQTLQCFRGEIASPRSQPCCTCRQGVGCWCTPGISSASQLTPLAAPGFRVASLGPYLCGPAAHSSGRRTHAVQRFSGLRGLMNTCVLPGNWKPKRTQIDLRS